jgi:hypothetical protein
MDKKTKAAPRASGSDIEFDPADFEVIDLTLGQIPELRICAVAVKRSRMAKLVYPIESAQGLFPLFEGKPFEGGGHRFSQADVPRFIAPEFFPINNETELISRIYIALVRCRHEDALRVRSSADVIKAQQKFDLREVSS